MKPDRKKDKMASFGAASGSPPRPLAASSFSNGTAPHVAGGVYSFHSYSTKQHEKHSYNACPPPPNLYGAPSATKQHEKPSYNACPPPPNSYGPPSAPGAMSSDKAKSVVSNGNSSDGEKKGRRRPARKSRQVTDSSGFPLSCSDKPFPADNSEESASVRRLSGELHQVVDTSRSLPSPSPNSMPNPGFKAKSVLELPFNSLSIAKSSIRSESRNLDRGSVEPLMSKPHFQSEQVGSPSFKSTTPMGSRSQDASCTVEFGGGLKPKNKESPPVGVPKSKSKDLSRTSKSGAGPCSKRPASLGIDSKHLSHKGWRMCPSSGNTSSSCAGSFDVPAIYGSSCLAGERVGVTSPPGKSPVGSPLLRSEAGVLGSPAICVSGSPDKFANGGGVTGITFGHSAPRTCYFNEHLSPEDAAQCIAAGQAFRGVLRVNTHNRNEAYVTLDGVSVDILLDGLCSQNRAMEGDIVAVQVNPSSQWPKLKGANNKQSSTSATDDGSNKAANSFENEFMLTIPDVLGHESVTTTENSLISGLDASLPSSTEDSENEVTLDGSLVLPLAGLPLRNSAIGGQNDTNGTKLGFPSVLGIDLKPSSQAKVRHFKCPGSGKEGGKDKTMDFDNSSIEVSLGDLATLVESMPGKRPTGKVVAVLGKSMRRDAIIGFLEVQGSNCGGRGYSSGSDFSPQKGGKKLPTRCGGGMMTFIPVENRFPKMVVFSSGIPESLSKRWKDGDPTVSSELVVAKVEGWRADSALPCAIVTQSLGPGGTIEAQTAAILFENAIHSVDFPPSSLACLPELPWKIRGEEVKSRKDFRGLRIFTIDPPTAKDLDDALSVENLDDGNVRIGVHIADVSYFVQPDTALDKEAQNRSTSVYLVRTMLPMLPPLLCEELCSLNPGVDRLCFSVMWTMDSAGNILEQWIGRSIICSCAQLTYGDAQEMIDGLFLIENEGNGQGQLKNGAPLLYGAHSWKEVISDVQKLDEVAKRRRESRFDGGALKLDNSKLVFTLDEEGEPYDSTMYQHQDSNFLVEEFMLLANMTVAKVISSAFPDRSLLRRHPEPNVRKMREFEEFCSRNGFELDTSSSGALHLSLEKMREAFQEDPVLFNVLMLYATKPMQLAKYFCTGDLKGQEEDWAHYALAVPLYTHFTSPIRRYPDLVVHRTVAAALEAEAVLCKDGVLSGERENSGTSAVTRLFQCFSGPMIEDGNGISFTEVAQKVLGKAAERHKIPELSELSLVAAHCNERRLASRNVKDASDKLYLWSMLKKKQGVFSDARVVALGPKFMSLYVCKIAMERRIYYDEIEGLNTEWFEATETLVLNLSSEKFPYKKYGQCRGRPQRTVADVALLVNPTDTISSSEEETYEDLIREVEDRLAGKIITDDDDCLRENKDGETDIQVEPAVLPLTLRWFSSVPVSVHAVGGDNRPLDIAVRLYVSSYDTTTT